MPKTAVKRSGGRDSWAGPYDGDAAPWMSRKMTVSTGKGKAASKKYMVPAYSKPTEAFDAVNKSFGDQAYKQKRGKAPGSR